MLIGKTFKADIENNPKGNLLAEDLGTQFAFLYPTAGILNITGQDASQFGGINIVGSTAQVTFHSGYIVIQGRLIKIEEGTEVAFNLPSSGTANGVIGVKINLAENGTNEVTWFQKTTAPQTDNILSSSQNGVYEFVIYSYTATANTFVLGEKTSEIISNIPADLLSKLQTQTLQLKSNDLTLTLHKMAGSNIVFASLDGTVKSKGSMWLGQNFYTGYIENFSFNIEDNRFKPVNDNIVFNVYDDKGANISSAHPFLYFGTTSAGNNVYVTVNNGGILKSNGKLEFTTHGRRDSDSKDIVGHPIHYTFVYLV